MGFVKQLFLLDYFFGHRRQAGKTDNKKGEASLPFLCDKPIYLFIGLAGGGP